MFDFLIVDILFAGQVVHPQYYSVQAPWGIYPANIVQGQQQNPQGTQLLRGQSRPLTPSQSDGMGTPNSGVQQPTAIQNPGTEKNSHSLINHD